MCCLYNARIVCASETIFLVNARFFHAFTKKIPLEVFFTSRGLAGPHPSPSPSVFGLIIYLIRENQHMGLFLVVMQQWKSSRLFPLACIPKEPPITKSEF